jgi:hypothetical protein
MRVAYSSRRPDFCRCLSAPEGFTPLAAFEDGAFAANAADENEARIFWAFRVPRMTPGELVKLANRAYPRRCRPKRWTRERSASDRHGERRQRRVNELDDLTTAGSIEAKAAQDGEKVSGCAERPLTSSGV